jgi:hypothetical protein
MVSSRNIAINPLAENPIIDNFEMVSSRNDGVSAVNKANINRFVGRKAEYRNKVTKANQCG